MMKHTLEADGSLWLGSSPPQPSRSQSQDVVSAMFRQHAASIRRQIYRLVGPTEQLDDLLQETFVVAWRKHRQFEDGTSERAWLGAIALRECQRFRREAARSSRLKRMHARCAEQLSAVTGACTPEAAEAVRRTLDRLSDAHRTVLVLCEIEGYTGPEVASALGISERTVWTRLHRARKRFLQLWSSDEQGAHPHRRSLASSLALLAPVDLAPIAGQGAKALAALEAQLLAAAAPVTVSVGATLLKGAGLSAVAATVAGLCVWSTGRWDAGRQPKVRRPVVARSSAVYDRRRSTSLAAPAVLQRPRASPKPSASTAAAPTLDHQPTVRRHRPASRRVLARRGRRRTVTRREGSSGPIGRQPRAKVPGQSDRALRVQLGLYWRARQALSSARFKRAIAQLDQLLARFPSGQLRQDAELLRLKALVGSRQHRRAAAEARAMLARSAHRTRRAPLLRLLADLEREAGRCGRAVRLYERALAAGMRADQAKQARSSLGYCRRIGR